MFISLEAIIRPLESIKIDSQDMALKRSDSPVKTILLLNGKGMSHELDIVKKKLPWEEKNVI